MYPSRLSPTKEIRPKYNRKNIAMPSSARSTSHAIGMSNAAASGRIEEDYAGSRPYQHAIELIRNATQQQGTTYVVSDIVAMPETGALKRTFVNNGPAMTAEELRSYMSIIGEGQGDLWRLHNTLGNRHAGARTAVLPWTDLRILSWDAELFPEGLEMTLFKNQASSEYEYTDVSTPDPQTLTMLTGRTEVQDSGHGVAFIYLGRDAAVDGPFCDPNSDKHETDNGLLDAVRDRIYAPVGTDGQSVTITINAPMPAAADKRHGGRKLVGVDGRRLRLDGRVIHGHHVWTERPSIRGKVIVDEDLGVEVHWTLLPADAEPTNRRLPFGGKGHIIARYKNESMVLAAPGSDYSDLATKMRMFGVHLADVYNRLCLEIVGPTDPGHDDVEDPRLHLHQDPTRSKLVLSNGQELPLARWGDAFIEKMPAAIADANKAARQRISRGGKIQLTTADRLKARLQSRIKSVIQSRRRAAGTGVLGPSSNPGCDYLDGMINTTETLPMGDAAQSGDEGVITSGSTRRKKASRRKGAKRRNPRVKAKAASTTRRRQPGSEKAVEVQPRPAPIPEPCPLTEVDWMSQGFDPADLASWDSANGIVYFNLGHPILNTQGAFFTGEWLDRNTRYRNRIQPEDVHRAVQEAYEEDTIGRIMHYVADHGLAAAKIALTDRILTIGAYGFENVQAKIEDLVRSSAGRGVVVTGAA